MDEFREELLQTAEGVKRVTRGLRPPELEEIGLEALRPSDSPDQYNCLLSGDRPPRRRWSHPRV